MAQDNVTNIKVFCQGGLNTVDSDFKLSNTNPGAATILHNFEPCGEGYRKVKGWSGITNNFINPGEYPIGVGVLDRNYPWGAKLNSAENAYTLWYFLGPSFFMINYPGTLAAYPETKVEGRIIQFQNESGTIFTDGINNAFIYRYNFNTFHILNSTNTGGSLSPGGDQVLDAPSFSAVFKNHLFLTGDSNYPNIICHSNPNDEFSFTAAGGGGQIICPFKVVQIAVLDDILYVFGTNKIMRVIADGASGFLLQDFAIDVGTIFPRSIVEMDKTLYFVSMEGVRYITREGQLSPVISSPIRENFQSFIWEALRSNGGIVSVPIRNKNQIRFVFQPQKRTAPGSFRNKFIMAKVDSQNGPSFQFSTIDFPVLYAGYSNVFSEGGVADSFASGSSEAYFFFGQNNDRLQLLEYTNKTGEPPSDITSTYQTPYIDMGDTEIRKNIRTVTVFLKRKGNNPSTNPIPLTLSVSYDWDNTSLNPPDYTYPGVAYVEEINTEGSGRSVRFKFVLSGSVDDNLATYTKTEYIITGFVVEFTPEGRQ